MANNRVIDKPLTSMAMLLLNYNLHHGCEGLASYLLRFQPKQPRSKHNATIKQLPGNHLIITSTFYTDNAVTMSPIHAL